MAGLLFYGSNLVMTIEVIGNESTTEDEILAVLEAHGICRGSWIPSIDFTQCEHALRSEVEELAWVGIRHTGNRIVVDVLESRTIPEMRQTRTPCNLVARYDAQIVSFSIYSGQVMRLVGDGVQEGELLVSGVVTDETGHVVVRHAAGSVIGIYTQQQTFTCNYVQDIRNATGDTMTREYLDLFTWHIPLDVSTEPYEESITTTSYSWFSLFGMELPIGIYRETMHEYQTHTLVFTLSEAKKNLAEQKKRYADNFLTEVEILDETTKLEENELGLCLTVTYTLQGEIASEEELYLQD